MCLLCFFHIKEDKKCYFTKVEPPRAPSNVLQASPRNVVPKFPPIPNQSAAYSSPYINRSASVPNSTHPQQYGQRNFSFTQPSSATGPPRAYPPGSAAPYQHSYSYSASLHPSQNSYPSSFPARGSPPASHYQGNLFQAGAPGGKEFGI